MRTHHSTRILAGVLWVAVVAAGCAGQGGQPAASGGAPTSSPAPSRPQPTTTPSTRDMPTDLVRVTVTGTVRRGVEPGCLLLDADQGRQWLLVGGRGADRRLLAPGARVQVVGTRSPGTVSTCQQGMPLEVISMRPAR